MSTYNIQGKIIDKGSKLAIPYAKIKVYEVDTIAGGFKSDLLVEGNGDAAGNFTITFAWGAIGKPDVIFQVYQQIGGIAKLIYDENPALQTRWNIGDYLTVTLETSGGFAINPPSSSRSYDHLFVFTRIGVIGVNRIDTIGGAATGYASPDTDPAAPNSADANAPFGATLDVCGWFGQFVNLVRYKLQYSTDGVTYQDVTDPFFNYYFELDSTGGHWATMAMGPFDEGGQVNLYKVPYIEKPGQPWIFPDLLGQWNTTKVVNGRYTLRIKGYKWVAGALQETSITDLDINPNYGTLKVTIDNTPPVAKLLDIWLNNDKKKVCDIVDFSAGSVLKIEFEASDANGHLRNYSLNAMYGHNQVVSPLPARAADDYGKHIGPTRHWSGGVFKKPPHAPTEFDAVEYIAAATPSAGAYSPTQMPTCAYQFRLNVTKRTTNGYGLIYNGVEDTMHITLKRS